RLLVSGGGESDTAGSISRDSRQIAYAWRPEGSASIELCVADLQTRTARTVYASSAFSRLVAFDWTADAHAVLVSLMDPSGVSQLAMISTSGGEARVLKAGITSLWKASLSPDGQFVAYD